MRELAFSREEIYRKEQHLRIYYLIFKKLKIIMIIIYTLSRTVRVQRAITLLR
nr:MAG TPA: hypothetical protein [Bacteriophage sp.]